MPDEPFATRVITTVAQALDTDPTDLPPLETTISADALNQLFADAPPGAFTVFPYQDVWVVAHADGTIHVFDEFRASSAMDPAPDERTVVLADNDHHAVYTGRDQLEEIHEVVENTADSEQAWTRLVNESDPEDGDA